MVFPNHRTTINGERTVIVYGNPILFSCFGRYQNHPEGATSAVYGSRSGILQHGNRLDVFGVDCRQVAFDTVDQHQSRTALTDRVLRTFTARTALTRLITRRVTAHVYRTLMVGLTVGLDDVQTRDLPL